MGVPVVTLPAGAPFREWAPAPGDIGLHELIADTDEAFIRVATNLRQIRAPGNASSQHARPHARLAPDDGPRFTRHLETAYRRCGDWCQ